jgi:hypothetical protein
VNERSLRTALDSRKSIGEQCFEQSKLCRTSSRPTTADDQAQSAVIAVKYID